jgi:hypothetical protein
MAPVQAVRGLGTLGIVRIEGVGHWEVRLRVQEGLNAVRGLFSGFGRPKCATEPKPALVGVDELVGALLQQARSAQEPHSSRRNVIGRKSDGTEGSLAVEEHPTHLTKAFDPNASGKTAKTSRVSLIDRPHKVFTVIRDRQTGSRVPNHLQKLRFVEGRVLFDPREGLLDPFWDGGQVGFGH